MLRGQYWLGSIMILLWLLSPLGGQSALRLLQVSPFHISSNISVRYLPIVAATSLTAMNGDSGASIGWPSYASIYMTSLTTYRRQANSTQDLFGNVRIPSFDRLSNPLVSDYNSWVNVSDGVEVPYASMLGVPVVGIPTQGNVSFHMMSRYLAVECKDPRQDDNSTVFQNNSELTNEGATFVTEWCPDPPTSTPWNQSIATFSMISGNDAGTSNVSIINCSMAPRDVESEISCIDQSCRVSAMRNLTVDLALWWDTDSTCHRISIEHLWLATLGALHHGSKMTSSLTEMWLQDPQAGYIAEAFGGFADLSQVPAASLSRNFEMLYNTFWQSTYGAQYLFGNLSTNMSLYDNISSGYPSFDFNTTAATVVSVGGEQYNCNVTFASILLVISALLLLASIATFVLLFCTLAPDILGFVSSCTRDNPFASVDQASHLDGLERTRDLTEMYVTIGDVHGEQEIGHIAFAAKAKAQQLHKGRLYD